MTETANWVAGASSTDGIEDGLVGKMWGGVAAVLDAEGRMYTQGEGEIVVQTPSLMSSYFRRDDLTEAVLREGWYRTGDRGTLDKGGVIRLNGRVKDEINRGGFKVQPAEIDALLVRHPAVADACAFAIADPVSGEIVGAAVAFKSGTDMSPEMLRAWCRQRLRREAVPERWYVVEAIPRSARGKLDRAAVRRAVTKAP
jgi:acyl-CoA synthetase (AMP-forming)/AMP-acid ligase II